MRCWDVSPARGPMKNTENDYEIKLEPVLGLVDAYLLDSSLNGGVNDKMCLRNFDILLEVQQRKLEFRKLFLRHRDAFWKLDGNLK